MTSIVEICNLALGNIRAGSINNINESSLQAQQCKLRFDLLRDQMLKENNWNFARNIVALAEVTDDIFTYAYVYSYPINCLKIERLIGEYEQMTGTGSASMNRAFDEAVSTLRTRRIPYDIFNVNDAKLIGANEPNLRIDYTKKVTDPNLFPAGFILAFSHLLASEIAIPIIGAAEGRKVRSDSLTLYKSYLESAVASDCNEKHHEAPESEFVTCRN